MKETYLASLYSVLIEIPLYADFMSILTAQPPSTSYPDVRLMEAA
jgi:hypothetical protein